MSAGSFQIARYETDDGAVRPIRVQPETIIAGTNPEAVGNLNGTLVRVSGSKRRIGLKARSMTLKQNIGAAVGGFQPTRTITLPVFSPTAFAALSIGTDVTYNGSAWDVAGKSSESGR